MPFSKNGWRKFYKTRLDDRKNATIAVAACFRTRLTGCRVLADQCRIEFRIIYNAVQRASRRVVVVWPALAQSVATDLGSVALHTRCSFQVRNSATFTLSAVDAKHAELCTRQCGASGARDVVRTRLSSSTTSLARSLRIVSPVARISAGDAGIAESARRPGRASRALVLLGTPLCCCALGARLARERKLATNAISANERKATSCTCQ